MSRKSNTEGLRTTAVIAAVVVLFLPAAGGLQGQRGPGQQGPQSHAAPAQPHALSPQGRPGEFQRQPQFQGPSQQQYQGQSRQMQSRPGQFHGQQRQYQSRPQTGDGLRQSPGYSAGARTSPGSSYPGTAYPNTAGGRPPYAGAPRAYSGVAASGHIGEWLNQHQGIPAQEQERMLRSDPSFNRLPHETQQRLIDQLHQLNRMPEAQRDRRLARNQMLEHLSPQEQMQVRNAGRNLLLLPSTRQTMVKCAFQDLRSVPLDQRETVLNSARYQNVFTYDERNILSNLLRAEPYEPSR